MEGTQLGVWVQHGEGRCHFPNMSVYETVQKCSLVPMRYVDDDGDRLCAEYGFRAFGLSAGWQLHQGMGGLKTSVNTEVSNDCREYLSQLSTVRFR